MQPNPWQQYPPQGPAPRASNSIAIVALILSLLGCFVFPLVNLALYVVFMNRDFTNPFLLFMIALGGLCVLGGFVLGIVALVRSRSGQTGAPVMGGLAIFFSVLSVVTATGASFLGLLLTSSGAHGRPLRARGRPREARVEAGDAWIATDVSPNVLEISPQIRDALATAWLADATLEHASVAAFARLTLDLIALGAPPELIQRAQRASLEEVDHARVCFALASAYAGRNVMAGAFPEAGEASGDASMAARLERVAVESAIDGCVGEGAAAVLAREAADEARDPVVAHALARIARDEQGHAELAREVLAFCISRGGNAVDRAVQLALSRELATTGGALPRWELAVHGRVHPTRWAIERERRRVELLTEWRAVRTAA